MVGILICLILVLAICLLVNKYRKMPPGPYGLPIIGYYPYLGENQIEKIKQLSEQYDDIMTMNIMGKTYWFLNSFEAIEEALVTKGDIFAARPVTESGVVNLASENVFGNSEGDEWKAQSRFVIGHLSKLGMGKSEFEITMHNLFDNVERYVEETNGTPHDFHEILSNFTFNTITALVASKHYDLNNDFFTTSRDLTAQIFSGLSGLNFILFGDLFMSWLKLKGNNVYVVKDSFEEMSDLTQKIINERLKTFDQNNCQDLLDYWIKENSGPNAEYFQLKYMSKNIAAMLMAGTDSSAATLYHCLHLMALHPNIQQKVFHEIDNTIGNEAMFCYLDKERLPYTQAVLSEIQRFVSFAPLANSHVNQVETTLRGYHVPKRTIVYANLFGITRNKKHFENPHEFDPNNFLNENGAFKANKALIPFGIGVRKCMGLKLAEVEIFIAFVRLMRMFEWTAVDTEAEGLPKTAKGVIRFMQPFKVCAKLRQ